MSGPNNGKTKETDAARDSKFVPAPPARDPSPKETDEATTPETQPDRQWREIFRGGSTRW